MQRHWVVPSCLALLLVLTTTQCRNGGSTDRGDARSTPDGADDSGAVADTDGRDLSEAEPGRDVADLDTTERADTDQHPNDGDSTSGDPAADTTSRAGVVDDMEDGDMKEYTGQRNKFKIRSSNTIAGSHSMQCPDAGAGNPGGLHKNGAYNTIASVSGLKRYPKPGDTFSVKIRVDDKDSYGAVLWGVQSGSHPWPGYRLRIDTGASEGLELEKIGGKHDSGDVDIESHKIDQNAPKNVLSDRENGGFAPQFSGDSYPIDPKPDVVYTCTITWKKNGKMPYVCRDPDGDVLGKDMDPKPDTEYGAGGIGFMSTQSGNYVQGRGATYDDFVIK